VKVEKTIRIRPVNPCRSGEFRSVYTPMQCKRFLLWGFETEMTSKDKPQGRAAGQRRGTLERLKPHESAAVLRRLLEAHPDLAGEAEQIARSLLHEVNYEEVAVQKLKMKSRRRIMRL
jgi:hypothetical protein